MHPFIVVILLCSALSAQPPTRDEALTALNKAIEFFHTKVAIHGGYVWKYSSDLQYRQGEGLAYDQRIWIQPPGTPAVGIAFMKAYEVTANPAHLKAANDAAQALVKGQLFSGGWDYSVTFDPDARKKINYRIAPSRGDPKIRIDPNAPGGWHVWRRRQYVANRMMLDDDTSQSALRLMMRVDKALQFKDERLHEAVEYGLGSMLKSQYPAGAWSHNYDRYPQQNPNEDYYPIKKATYPKAWSRKWDKKFSGCYHLNDRITLDCIKTMLDAYQFYEDRKYLDSALLGGKFLLLAQLPEPQPAWAQQYDLHMQPVWERGFEPPAITGWESQDVLVTLLLIYDRTKNKKFLEPVPRALEYLKSCKLSDGKLARFYELKTNRPLYFTKKYQLTYDRGAMPGHYGFVAESRLDEIESEYNLLLKGEKKPKSSHSVLAEETRKIIDTMDARGAWTTPGWVRNRKGKKVVTSAGIIQSATFIRNIELLVGYITSENN